MSALRPLLCVFLLTSACSSDCDSEASAASTESGAAEALPSGGSGGESGGEPGTVSSTSVGATSGGTPVSSAPGAESDGALGGGSMGSTLTGATPASGGTEDQAALPGDTGGSDSSAEETATVTLPPENGGLDYQLGGDYTPPAGVEIVSRDREGDPAPGLYNICYVNGFQTQPGELSFWEGQHPELLLRDGGGEPVIDPDWPDERMLDVSTADKRAAIAAIEESWIKGCADRGFDAVEIDNLDTYSRSGNLLSEDDAVAFIRLLADIAHRHGLAIAQKNAAEIVGRKSEMGTDFVVAEECSSWDECDVYIEGYGTHVLMIEYVRGDFDKGCRDYPDYSIVLRDVPLRTPGSSGYVYEGC